MADLKFREFEEGVIVEAKIVPGSSRTSLAGLLDGMLKIKVAAAPEKGKANKCVCEFLAKQLAVNKKSVTVISGQNSPLKSIEICGISGGTLLERLKLDK
jgi:uncharacterized protein (TIGR00251 family)